MTASVFTELFDSLTPVLINRFIINLRTLDTSSTAGELPSLSSFSNPNFRVPATVLGNITQDMHWNQDEQAPEDDIGIVGEDEGDERGIMELTRQLPDNEGTMVHVIPQ
ncbi:hypothetical protein PsYK624_065830 [Phanerochaete sordida]|uniref:Uncharacterized protein n=1 Tax=Phanerochaete sordida TaxID=48140 RepID=A0A9P3LDK1_9APHY|nr:hypothetical protein PsYK624_065830 [Phanerochaete sordida]